MKIVFCKKWNSLLNKPREPIGKEKARSFHDSQTPYTVVFYKNDKLFRIIKMNFQEYHCEIVYFDMEEREIRSESFHLVEQRLFMKDVSNRKYQQGKEYSKLQSFLYQEDGSYRLTEYLPQPGTTKRLTKTSSGNSDPTVLFRDNWIFDDYENLFQEQD